MYFGRQKAEIGGKDEENEVAFVNPSFARHFDIE